MKLSQGTGRQVKQVESRPIDFQGVASTYILFLGNCRGLIGPSRVGPSSQHCDGIAGFIFASCLYLKLQAIGEDYRVLKTL